MKKHGFDTTDLCYMAEKQSVENAIECIRQAKPTAILSIAKYSEDIVSALKKLSLKFPDDISLMVYDDVEWARMLDISAVAHPLEEIATTSLEMILHRLKEKDASPTHRTMRAHLVHRNSVKNIIPL
jgi:DNA-binding LacI/PurR family transcriptional regulator